MVFVISWMVIIQAAAFAWMFKISSRLEKLSSLRTLDNESNTAKMDFLETDISNLAVEMGKRVSKDDKIYQEMSRVMKDAENEGEGYFAVRKMDSSEFFTRIDPKEIYKRSR